MGKFSNFILLITLCSGIFRGLHAEKTVYASRMSDWQEKPVPASGSLTHSVFLLGDIKYPSQYPDVLTVLKSRLSKASSASSLIILGDIVYPKGLPAEGTPLYEAAVKDLDLILNSVHGFKGKTLFIPGNHDWDKGGRNGLESIRNLQRVIQAQKESSLIFLPENGCPGPAEYLLADDVAAIVFDSQWWLQKHEKNGPGDECGFRSEADLMIQIEDMIRRHQDKIVIFAAHHPLFSVGKHGGHFPAYKHFFPLKNENNHLYVPLPGFLYTGYRKFFGSIQDAAHPDYKLFINLMLDLLQDYDNVVYTAGHEHNLQYVQHQNLHHIVSGGGTEGTWVASHSDKADFAAALPGWSQLDFYENGEVWAAFWTPEGHDAKLIFRHCLFNRNDVIVQESRDANVDFADSTTALAIAPDYDQRGRLTRYWLGEGYRSAWAQEVRFPVFDIERERGGLTILKRGGGMQSLSVRLADSTGRQFVLRSVNKYAGKALNRGLKNTLTELIMQDVIASLHPYASVTVPPMADAAGVFHTNPSLVWVPDDPALGIYRKDMANQVFLFEERPDDNREEVASFGRSKKIVSTAKTIEKTRDKHNHFVQQSDVARARLFDMWIGDWDRHEDQWRWATFKEKGRTLYKPIPRDRDHVYFMSRGLGLRIASLDFILPRYQAFDHELKNVNGFNISAKFFDRTFTSELNYDNWMAEARHLQQCLTDSVIHAGISRFPKGVYDIDGPAIESILRSRRAHLADFADTYYHYLAEAVDVIGTDQRDFFDIRRLKNGNTDVSVYALSAKKGKRKERIYHREFKPEETREIRLYGLKKEDVFEVTGKAPEAIKIRLIGGKGRDSFKDESDIDGRAKTVLIYDRKDKKNHIETGRETRLKLSTKKVVNQYNRSQFRPDINIPLAGGGYNRDDGFYVTGGVFAKRYNFRDSTFHKITGSVAFATGAFQLKYDGHKSRHADYFDVELPAVLAVPRNVDNYFGMGNETPRESGRGSWYRVRYQHGRINPALIHHWKPDWIYKIGVFYEYNHVQKMENRFISQAGLKADAFEKHHYLGLNAIIDIDERDHAVLPERGLRWRSEAAGYYRFTEEKTTLLRVQSDLSAFISFTADPRAVLALRLGGAANLGDYVFYHANALGRKHNLRGFVNRRFSGDRSFYQNTEIRFKLYDFKNFLFHGQTGLLCFHDVGRVWVKGEKSAQWHRGWGTGLWLAPFNYTVIALSYSASHDDRMIEFNLNFQY